MEEWFLLYSKEATFSSSMKKNNIPRLSSRSQSESHGDQSVREGKKINQRDGVSNDCGYTSLRMTRELVTQREFHRKVPLEESRLDDNEEW